LSHKIMVVDDNTATRRMVRNALQRRGHDVVEAADGKSARELMRSEQPVLVIQDLMLPDADGFTLVGELRNLARGTDVSILAFSGFVSELEEARVSTVGFDDIISKPIAPSRLVPIVEAHLPSRVASAEQFGAGRRLVLADDDPMQLKLASYRLTRLGFEVEAVADGAAVLEALRRKMADAIVSDVMMPELDGFGLAMAVRQDPALSRVPVVLVTSSYVESADRDLARRAGATDLVPRTPELVEVLDALRATFSAKPEVRSLPPEAVPDLEREHSMRVFRQLERQVMLNTGLAKRCSVLSSELAVLTGISEAVLKHRDIDIALDEALAACFDAGGISIGALYLVDPALGLRVRPIGNSLTAELTTDLTTLYGHNELLNQYIAEGRTLTVPAPGLPPDLERELLSRASATAMLMVPLVHLERKLGALLMVARGRELDHDDWKTFAHGVATQISHVLALASAYADLEVAERRATDHAALLDAVVDNAPDFVVQLDLDGTIRFVNRAESPYDTTPKLDTNIFDYPAGDHVAAMRKALQRVAETGEPQGFEAQVMREGGKQVWYSTRLGPIKQRGQVTGAVLVARDVSESKQTELHLMVADRMASVGTLAAGVAHEINNPLASVIANLDMAMQDLEGVDRNMLPNELVDELGDARTAADRVREIVRDLKIFSRAEEERRGPVDVEHVLESTLRMAWNELRHRAKLVKVFGKVPEVEANESRLGQVFLNLIINAAHAIAPGNYEANQIKVTTSTDASGRVVIAIADTGTGIPVEARQRLFTPFFTTKPVGVGTGLGLAISHRIITQFGGTITFDTEVGRGTEFRVTLPAAGSRFYEPSPGPTKTIPPARRGTVLVIDDEEPLALAMRRFLSQDHEVTAVHSARAALDLLEGGTRFDVILCDLMMPQITGMELHGALAKLDRDQARRVVFMTGGAFTTSAREFLDTIDNPRLEKPFDLKDLRKMVNDLIR
jgi:PAS domain S-box-containing protein